MSGGGSGANAYWPGFVDALTNVVIAMIFVVVVLAISLSFAAQMMGKKLAEKLIEEHKAKVAQAPPAPAVPAQLPAQESALARTTRIAVVGNEAPASAPATAVRQVRNTLQLDYAAAAITLDPAAADRFKAAVAGLGGSLAQRRVQIVAGGPGMSISDNPKPSEFQAIAEATKERPDAQQIHTMLLRSMQQAIYTPINSGHFGLAYEAYTHFTSPIRRYPDLLVHRVIKAILAGGKYELPALPTPGEAHEKLARRLAARVKAPGQKPRKPAPAPSKDVQAWEAAGLHCSANERRADEASRDVEAWLKCKYMREHLGEEYGGVVTAATSFGIFVTLDAMYVEGLVHITELGGEYFRFDEARQELRGERSGVRYIVGARVRVQVGGHAGSQLYLAVAPAGQHDDGRLELVFQLVQRFAQRSGVGAFQLGGNLLSLKFSRDDESEADVVGLDLAARAGFDPRAGISLWQKMAKASTGGPPQWLSTHPSNETRQGDLAQYAARVMPLYEQATQHAKPVK